MKLSNRTILITGATAGIGKACAELLARPETAGEGTKLILTGRREDRLKEVAASLAVPCHILAFDMRDRDAMTNALDALPPEFSKVDILINNAGLALGLEPADKAEFSDWETMVETNIVGLIAITRALLPAMRARGCGHIVNLSSIAGTYPYAGGNVYGATKAFVTQFSLNLRADLLGSPVRVTNIEPGMVETEFSEVRFKGDSSRAASVYDRVTPLSAEDIAETVRWALTQPAHVNINRIELMCTMQAPGGVAVARNS
jgi:3-hydroxy acid dehydrogenase / malonic semialdehyde reductase